MSITAVVNWTAVLFGRLVPKEKLALYAGRSNQYYVQEPETILDLCYTGNPNILDQ